MYFPPFMETAPEVPLLAKVDVLVLVWVFTLLSFGLVAAEAILKDPKNTRTSNAIKEYLMSQKFLPIGRT